MEDEVFLLSMEIETGRAEKASNAFKLASKFF